MAKQDDWVRMTLRLPRELHDRLTSAVAEGVHSLNAEIVMRLAESLAASSPMKSRLASRLEKDRIDLGRLHREYEYAEKNLENVQRRITGIERDIAEAERKLREGETDDPVAAADVDAPEPRRRRLIDI